MKSKETALRFEKALVSNREVERRAEIINARCGRCIRTEGEEGRGRGRVEFK